MSWIQRLYETYERNHSQVGLRNEESNAVLLPIAHIESRADIEVVLDGKGNFLSGKLLNANEPKIIIPCTEASAGRAGSKPINHPLSDKLQYLAGDYQKYGGKKWFAYKEYMDSLSDWANSKYTNDKLSSIFQYLKKGCLIRDLVSVGVLTIDEKGMLEGKWDKRLFKGAPNTNQEDAIVKWQVEIPNVLEPRVWMDTEMYNSWISFYFSREEENGYCQILEQDAPLAFNHPKNIYSLCANAKIISSNDDKGFTFRGRFDSPNQAYGVSYEVSQKAHNALKWLISKQGYSKDQKVILCWGVAKNELPDIFQDSLSLFDEGTTENNDDHGYTAEEMAYSLKNKIRGYSSKIGINQVVIMGLESATDGRLSITYYQELMEADFLNRLEKWHLDCCWLHKYENKFYYGAPAPMNIAEVVYGSGKHVDMKAKMRIVERILSCIIDGYKIPIDIVTLAVNKTIHRISYDSELHDRKKNNDLDKILSITNAVYNKYCKDYKKGEYLVALETERKTRDYLYGRLLAVAQNVEQWAHNMTNESRMTNADRLMHRFAEHPFSTWKTIELSLKPYFSRLQPNQRQAREKLIDDIMALFDSEEFINDKKLSGEFLLGYHCQRRDLHKKKESVIEEI